MKVIRSLEPPFAESVLRELTFALLMYEKARPEHQEAAASHLKEMVTLASGHGILTDEEAAQFFELEGMRGA